MSPRKRRDFLRTGAIGSAAAFYSLSNISLAQTPERSSLSEALPDEDVSSYIRRTNGQWNEALYRRILGSANPFKEGDAILGIAASDAGERENARRLLAATPISFINDHPPFRDDLLNYIEAGRTPLYEVRPSLRTLGDLRRFLIESDEADIHAIKSHLSSDSIACVVKLMTDDELMRVSGKIFNALPGSKIGARGYLGARVQPNSPTDNVDDIRWQVFDAFAYAVGDLLLGTNPVSSNPQSVAAVEKTLADILQTFGLQEAMPHCVLAHIDVQAEVETKEPGITALWFQSIAGNDTANATFDISLDKMRRYAQSRTGPFGLYFETGQGADFTNGHGHGTDMVIHESRKYGLARALTQEVCRARGKDAAWVHVNDVAGFIGPEVFRTKEQLVRCCLEDLVMGKLHGLTIGLDVCATLHMDISLDDLDWCLEQIAPAAPAYLMALPTKIDPMLGYLTTGYQDHVRLRERFGLRINDRMQTFFEELDVLDHLGRPAANFGKPLEIYIAYCRRRGDKRSEQEIRIDGKNRMRQVRERGVFIAEGFGRSPAELASDTNRHIRRIVEDAKKCIHREWDDEFLKTIPGVVRVKTQSRDREDYILHPTTGEALSPESKQVVSDLIRERGTTSQVQLVISEGLNALALMDQGNLHPLLSAIRKGCEDRSIGCAADILVVASGRVRAGYRIGEQLFAGSEKTHTLIHIIGERPGSGHHTMSAYITTADGKVWRQGSIDHDRTRVVSGISTTALQPEIAALEIMRIING
ncbi:MAG: ethanolamine ammonia-lyase subunit EutB [Pirellulales bacterium]